MKCENCIACKSYWNGNEEETYCEIGISEEEAYHDGEWYCEYNHKTIRDKSNKGSEVGMADIGYSEEDVKDWEQLPLVLSVLTSSHFGAWLYYRDKRRDKRVNSELLDKVMQKQRTIIDDDGVMYRAVLLKDIEELKAEVR